MLRLPEEFADGREWTLERPAPPGEGWTLPWDPGAGELVAHPSHVLGPEIWLAVETWRAAKAVATAAAVGRAAAWMGSVAQTTGPGEGLGVAG